MVTGKSITATWNEHQDILILTVYSGFCSSTHQRKHQSSASLASVRGIHWWPVDSPHIGGKSFHSMTSLCVWLNNLAIHDDVIKWKYFPRYWPFVLGIHRSPVNSPHKGQWLGALMFSLICVWINGWANNREAGDLRRYRAHYDVTVMQQHAAKSKSRQLPK